MDKDNFTEERSKDWGIEGVRQLMRGNIRISNLYFSIVNPKYFSGYTYELDMEDNAVVVVKVNVPKNLKQDDISVKYNS